jgi:F0F1-type ATP synthase alpha subunit
VNQCREFEKGLYPYVDNVNPKLFETIETKKALDDSIKSEMNKVLKEFKQRFLSEREAALAVASK